MGAACERIGYCSWQQGGRRAMPPRLGVCVWEVASHLFFFISDYSFIFPQILKFLRGRVLPRKITNLGLLSHIFIRQVLEGCSWVSSVPGWGHTAVFFPPVNFLIGDTPYPTDTQQSSCSVAQAVLKECGLISC